MRGPDVATVLIAHGVAAGAYLTLFLVAPAVLGVVAVGSLLIAGLVTGDWGGPLFLPAVVVLGVIYALCVAAFGVVVFALTVGLQALRRRVRVATWVPVALAFPVAFAALAPAPSGRLCLSLAASAAFAAYWLAFSGSAGLLKWLRTVHGARRKTDIETNRLALEGRPPCRPSN